MNLSRKAELKLIEIGLIKVVNDLIAPQAREKKTNRHWTPGQKKKFIATMKKKFANRDKQ